MSRRDKVGTVIGVIGMLFCIAGIAAPAVMTLVDSTQSVTFFKMITLEIGAALLFFSALLGGRNARMFQILEGSAVMFGAIYFLGFEPATNLALRISGTLLLATLLWRVGLLRGAVNKIGAVGLDAIGYGQIMNSSVGFALGGLLLCGFSLAQLKRQGGWVNKLWLALNVPFAAVSTFQMLYELRQAMGWLVTAEIAVAFVVGSFATAIVTMVMRFAWAVDQPKINCSAPSWRYRAEALFKVNPYSRRCYEVSPDVRIAPRLFLAIQHATDRLLSLRHFANLSTEQLNQAREHQWEMYGNAIFSRLDDDIRALTNEQVRQHYCQLLDFLVNLNRYCSEWVRENPKIAETIRKAEEMDTSWEAAEEHELLPI